MPEVVARSRFEAEPSAAQVDLVEIRFEDLILGVVPLHLPRGCLFMKLARKTRRPAHLAAVDDVRMHVPDELLRDGAAAALSADDLAERRGRGRLDIDAVVLVEALVFGGDERLRHVPRQRLE